MTKYGYIGKNNDIPQQAFKANAGVLSVNEHIKLSQENKFSILQKILTYPFRISVLIFHQEEA